MFQKIQETRLISIVSQPIELFLVKTFTQPNLNYSWFDTKQGQLSPAQLLIGQMHQTPFLVHLSSNVCVKTSSNFYEIKTNYCI